MPDVQPNTLPSQPDPTFTSTSTPTLSTAAAIPSTSIALQHKANSHHVVVIAMVVIGSIVATTIVVVVSYCFWRRRTPGSLVDPWEGQTPTLAHDVGEQNRSQSLGPPAYTSNATSESGTLLSTSPRSTVVWDFTPGLYPHKRS